jgi:hypothetical protein
MPAQVTDFGTDPRGAPVTPYDAMIPAPRSRGSKGTFVALALAIAFGGGAFVGFGQMGWLGGSNDAAHVAAHAVKPAAPAQATAPVPSPAPAPEPTASEAPANAPSTEPAGTAAAQPKATHRSAGHVASRAVTSAPVTEPKPVVQKASTSKPGAKSGFVPPPMSDPGF